MKIKTHDDLIVNIISLYRKARKAKFSDPKIFRGRSHSIGSEIEDLFAYYLTQHIKCDQIFIDQPLKVEGIDGKNIYPDLVIIRDGEIVAFLDLKTDLGWMRKSLFSLAKKYSNLITKIKGKNVSLKVGETKEKLDFKVSDKVIYDIVIITSTNINQQLLELQLNQTINLRPEVDVFILTKGKHLNEYNISTESLLSKIIINSEDFARMFNKLNK